MNVREVHFSAFLMGLRMRLKNMAVKSKIGCKTDLKLKSSLKETKSLDPDSILVTEEAASAEPQSHKRRALLLSICPG